MEISLTAIPRELKVHPNFVVWRVADRGGKPTKVPMDPKTGEPAKSNDPATWGTFQEAVAAWRRNGAAGIGFMFSADDRFAGIDLGHALVEGNTRLCAQVLLNYLQSYSEASPSGSGLHIWVRGKLPPGRRRLNLPCGLGIETYDRDRFFTLTGHHLPGTPTTIEDRQAELAALHGLLFRPPGRQSESPRPGPSPTLDLSDQEIIDRAH